MSSSSTTGSVKYSMRILNTNVAGSQNVIDALAALKDIGRTFAKLICQKAEINPTKRVGELTTDEVKLVESMVQNPARYNIPSFKTKGYGPFSKGYPVEWLLSVLDNIIN
ncbi:ribosomal 40S subunit protein S18B [Cladophialophora chaetospira]|uniref:Ribosomal 40S subunit protein S18B n=1 Tax=Cladophialophora chaetospira TaxID=386627 RepID=A0AA38XAS2_9EURO|nr:ribosomal 40S subunit protein S18B [Cladophialophora chaetospira]